MIDALPMSNLNRPNYPSAFRSAIDKLRELLGLAIIECYSKPGAFIPLDPNFAISSKQAESSTTTYKDISPN
jgi:hypothetical protein